MSHAVEQKRDAWSKRFERFSDSQLAITRFCAAERVPVASFYYWRKKLGREDLRRRARRTLGDGQQFAPPEHVSEVAETERFATGSTYGDRLREEELPSQAKSQPPCRSAPPSPSKPQPPSRSKCHQQSFAESGSFRAVSVVQAPLRGSAKVAIHLPGGIRIEVNADDVDALGTVIAEVRRREPAAVDTRRNESSCRELACCQSGGESGFCQSSCRESGGIASA